MKLRVNLTLTHQRQIDLSDVPTGIHPGDLKALIFATAKREVGEYDEMRIVSMEEVVGAADDAPTQVRISKKLERALAVAASRPDLFPVTVTLSRQRLYDALAHQGYRWQGRTFTWQPKGDDHV